MNNLLWAVLLSMTPVGELRVGIPFALASGISPVTAFIVCVVANILIVPVVFFFLEVVHYRFMHFHRYRSAFDIFMERTRTKVNPFVDKYGMFGLALFVAIPFPGTGAYTGAFAAWFFGMNKWKAFISIAIGVAVAGTIMMSVFVPGLKFFGVI